MSTLGDCPHSARAQITPETEATEETQDKFKYWSSTENLKGSCACFEDIKEEFALSGSEDNSWKRTLMGTERWRESAPPCSPVRSHRQVLGSAPATWPSPPVHTGVGAYCSKKEGEGRLCFPGVSWAGPGKPSPQDFRQDSSLVLQGRCNTAAPAAGLLKRQMNRCEHSRKNPLPVTPRAVSG